MNIEQMKKTIEESEAYHKALIASPNQIAFAAGFDSVFKDHTLSISIGDKERLIRLKGESTPFYMGRKQEHAFEFGAVFALDSILERL